MMLRRPEGMTPLPPTRKWRAITVASVLLVPALWSPALGFALAPFVFLALAFLSEHPRPPAATLRAMGLFLVVAAALVIVTLDAVTGFVAGAGAGGIVALRADEPHTWRSRAVAVSLAAVYTFALVHTAGELALLPAPVLPFTAIGVADHLAERRAERRREPDGPLVRPRAR